MRLPLSQAGLSQSSLTKRTPARARCLGLFFKPAVSRQAADWLVAFRMPGEGMRGDAMPAIALGSARGVGSAGQRNHCRSGAHLCLPGRNISGEPDHRVNLKNGWPRTYSEVPSGPAACQPYNPTNSRLERGYTATIWSSRAARACHRSAVAAGCDLRRSPR